MNEPKKIEEDIFRIMISQRVGVLSTQQKGAPYSSLVAFASSENLSELYFCTPRTTRKFRNITMEKRVSMLIDDRVNRAADFHEARAVTAIGEARELKDAERKTALEAFVSKHPYLTDFARALSCAVMEIKVQKYIMVQRFQHVTELHMVK